MITDNQVTFYASTTTSIKCLFYMLLVGFLGGCNQDSPTKTDGLQISQEEKDLRTSLKDLMKISAIRDTPIDFHYGEKESKPIYDRYRLEYGSNNENVPGYLLVPKDAIAPYPVMICLQGHAPGMYISMGEYRNEKDKKLVAGGRDLALQAINNGWAALVIEQKGFGERQKDSLSCNHQSLQELLKGRSMLGQRVYDITRAVDMIYAQDSLDNDKIGIIGNSSGGTTGYYAAAVDKRIDLAVVSCSFGTFETSWMKYPHCACGYLPGLLEVADMPDLAQLIAPRNLIVVAGDQDYLADIAGVREGFEIAKGFYQKHNATENLALVVGNGGHQFYPEKTWPIVRKIKANW